MIAPDPNAALTETLDRGDKYVRAGDMRSALAFYQSAMEARVDPSTLQPALIERLRSAHEFVAARKSDLQREVDAAVADYSELDATGAVRMQHMIEMLSGRRQIYLSEPTVLFTPYLSQRQFFERDEFAWVAEMEAATSDIRAELLALIDDGGPEFRPYVDDPGNRPTRPNLPLVNDPSWSALYLWRGGEVVPEVAERCPKTMAALAKVPMSAIGSRTPIALFSRLTPGAHIPPHNGMLNCRIICHLPLIVPPGCTLRVGNETREWREGEMLMFDDTFEHEAHNPSEEIRIILLFDVWRPELSEAERRAISRIFTALDEFGGAPADG